MVVSLTTMHQLTSLTHIVEVKLSLGLPHYSTVGGLSFPIET